MPCRTVRPFSQQQTLQTEPPPACPSLRRGGETERCSVEEAGEGAGLEHSPLSDKEESASQTAIVCVEFWLRCCDRRPGHTCTLAIRCVSARYTHRPDLLTVTDWGHHGGGARRRADETAADYGRAAGMPPDVRGEVLLTRETSPPPPMAARGIVQRFRPAGCHVHH